MHKMAMAMSWWRVWLATGKVTVFGQHSFKPLPNSPHIHGRLFYFSPLLMTKYDTKYFFNC